MSDDEQTPKPKKQPGSYSVGYAKPPEHSKYRKGVSGNPSGRRTKPRPTSADIFARTLLEEKEIKINGKKKKITPLELVLMQLVKKASEGDTRAIKLLLDRGSYLLPKSGFPDRFKDFSAGQLAELLARIRLFKEHIETPGGQDCGDEKKRKVDP